MSSVNSSETQQTWNKLAEAYEERFMHLELYNSSYEYLIDLLPVGAHILELGCGPGVVTQHLENSGKNFKILATDYAPTMVDLAQKNFPNIECKVLDARNLDSIQTTFDAIVCGFIIPYLNDAELRKFIIDCSQKLKPKGLLYLSFVEGDYADSGYKTGSTGDRALFHYYSKNQLLALCESNELLIENALDFEYKTQTSLSEIHTVLILRK